MTDNKQTRPPGTGETLRRFFTVKQVAHRYGKAERTVRYWIENGYLEAKKHKVLGTLFVSESALHAFEQSLGDRPGRTEPEDRSEAVLLDATDG